MSKKALFPEKSVEQTEDGAFRRQRNHFHIRFGSEEGQAPVEAGRYRLLVATGCGWSRRQTILLRLLGLDEVISVGYLTGRGSDGWEFTDSPGGLDEVLQVPRLNDLYRQTDPNFIGRATVPTVVDIKTGKVVTNDYHTLSIDLVTVWKEFHKDDAPDLYPVDKEIEIDLLNQQLFDDVNNGPYKVLFPRSNEAAKVAKQVWEARLAELDFRLASRRYLFGDKLTESDIRLFVTLASFDIGYRPSFRPEVGDAAQIKDFPNLWAYARDLYQTPGFVDDREKVSLGLLPGKNGEFTLGFGIDKRPNPDSNPEAAWLEPHNREQLVGSPEANGPGSSGTAELWHWGAR